MSEKFITQAIEINIYENVVNVVFPKLILQHKKILLNYLIKMLDVLSYIYDFKGDDYMHQLRQNNYQDVKWLLLYLLPYLNESPSSIVLLDEIYTKKHKNVDINKEPPKYVYSNLQYGRCDRLSDSNKIEELKFDISHITHNFYLFLDTIRVSSHKLYVNWMDILPYTIKEISSTTLYSATNSQFLLQQVEDWNPVLDVKENMTDADNLNLKNKLVGLYVGDIYNVIRTYLYDDIKTVKWLIYDFIQTNGGFGPCIYLLKDAFETDEDMLFNKMLNDVKWSELTSSNQSSFSKIWDSMVSHALNKKNFEIPATNVIGQSMDRIIKSMIVVFDNHYAKNNQRVIGSGYINIKKSLERDNDEKDDDEDNRVINLFQILKTIRSIRPMFMYDFIRRDLQTFKFTYYGTSVLIPNKLDLQEEYNLIFDSDIESNVQKNMRIDVTQKNVYNFCKSMVQDTDLTNKQQVYEPFPKHWKMLEQNQKDEFLKRLNNKYVNATDWFNISQYIRYMNNVDDNRISKAEITRENTKIYMCIRDCFVSIIFNVLTTKGILSKFSPQKTITDSVYCVRDKINEKLKLTVFSAESPYWQNSYYYLTELPYSLTGSFVLQEDEKTYNIFSYNSKRAWYKAYALDWVAQLGFCHHFIHNRVSYVTGATGVGKSTQAPKLYMYYLKAIDCNSMGRVVCTQPRKTPTGKNADIVSTELGVPIYSEGKDTKNYFVQMQYRGKSHKNFVQSLSLKFITDGSLIQELVDPMLLEKKSLDEKSPDRYSGKNQYDVIIIDEAHEHNKYMDFLLTFMRSPAYYNSTIRLVILSATMDEDEPVYRRFYRNVNDNKKFPLDCWLRDSSLDRINVDRRFHISPPGLGTSFVIKDNYVNGSDPIVQITSLVKTGLDGDVLLFEPGRKEIDDAVTQLNKILPHNVIAVPYHSQLNEKRREFIENLADKIKTLKIDKIDDFDTAKSLEKGSGTYNRFVIVATNIAEASITIRTLKYVIETGTQKTNLYDYNKRGFSLSVTNISESSRLQRRGRVGRTGPGSVYYLYEKDKMYNNKTQYNISIEDISNDLYNKLSFKHDDKEFFNSDFTLQMVNEPTDSLTLNEIIQKLYCTVKGYYEYNGNLTQYDYKNNIAPPSILKTGYSMINLTDGDGTFYIVHPEELNLMRNICGQICSSKKSDVIFTKSIGKGYGTIKSKKLLSFWEDFYLMNFLTIKGDKTEFGLFMMDTLESVQFDNINFGRAFIYGIIFGQQEKMSQILAFLNATSGDFKKILLQDSFFRYNLNEVVTKFGEFSSDLDFIYLITSSLINYLIKNVDTFNLDKILDKLSLQFKISQMSLKKIIFDFEYDDPNIEDDYRTKIMQYAREIIMLGSTTKQHIQEWSTIYKVNGDAMTAFIKEYLIIGDMISQMNHPKEGKRNYVEYIKQLKVDYLKTFDTSIDLTKMAFCLALPYNICKSIPSTTKYLSIYSPTLENIYSVQSLSKNRYMPSTGVKKMYLTNYLMFTNINVELETISMVTYLSVNYLKYLKKIYNEKRIKQIIETNLISKISEYIINKGNNVVKSDYKILVNIKQTFDSLIKDLE